MIAINLQIQFLTYVVIYIILFRSNFVALNQNKSILGIHKCGKQDNVNTGINSPLA